MNKEMILVTGGARSGKSEFAERLVLHYGRKCAYIATAEIFDDEMAERVRIHQERRSPQRWNNYEAPYGAEKTLAEAGNEVDVILFDCLTLYMSNLMYGKVSYEGTFEKKVALSKMKLPNYWAAAKATGKLVVFVTNEVGSGIVPDNQMAREYRDLAGWVNQQVAEACDRVFYCIAGQAVDVKKLAFRFEDEGV